MRKPGPGFFDPGAADLGLADAGPDRAIDAFRILGFPARPHGQARGADERGAEQVTKRLRRAVLGQKLLHVEIDRRRPDAFTVLMVCFG